MSERKKTLPPEMQVAVIGIAGRFPGAQNVQEFWHNLSQGIESITFFSPETLPIWKMQPDLLKDPNFVAAKGVIQQPEYFDAAFFGYSQREVEVMDPQMRLFHECVWEALEDAGYNPEGKNGSVGLFAGASANVYWQGISLLSRSSSAGEQFAALSYTDKDFMNAQVAYKLNLNGPGVTVDSACSTSLVAIHLACRSILTGECSMAIAGGVSVPVPSPAGYLYQEGMILSPDGHCRAFDEHATGTVPGEGVGVVVVKSLKRALADGDHIYAVIRGSAINNDGNRKIGFTAPSIEGQTDVIRAAHRMSMVEPESISYVEAHGTGTVLGDPIEIAALTAAFQTEKRGYCQIGSVKSNVGHLDAASGVAGFIKTVLALQQQQIPPSLHYEQPNPQIDFAHSPFVVATRLQPWLTEGGPRRAGVSSFGIGGTNAHVILEEAPPRSASGPSRPWQLLPLSARTETALPQVITRLKQHLETHPELVLADVAHTLQVGRAHFSHRRALVCSSVAEAMAALDEALHTPEQPRKRPQKTPTIAFLFPGQGSQYVNMGRELYEQEAVFRAVMDDCFVRAEAYGLPELKAVLYPAQESLEAQERLTRTELAQPALFSVEYALAQLMSSWGLRPHSLLGHSLGEYVAACLAGVLTLEDALRLVIRRGHLMGQAQPGVMVSVSLSEGELQPYLQGQLSLAASNAPALCVVAGSASEIEALEERLQQDGRRFRRLQTSHAFHSVLMEPILASFEQEVRQVTLSEPRLPYLSNLTGGWMQAQEATSVRYWVQHVRQTVRFGQGIDQLFENEDTILIEVGPGTTLSTFARKSQRATRESVIVSLLRHPQDQQPESACLLKGIGRLWEAGVDLEWSKLLRSEQRQRLSLPTYPFERQRFWLDETLVESAFLAERRLGPTSPAAITHASTQKTYFYLPTWERQPQLQQIHSQQPRSHATYLFFQDDDGITAALAERLQGDGCTIITVTKGSAYTNQLASSAHLFSIDPEQEEHFQRLIDDISGTIDTIIYGWGLEHSFAHEDRPVHMQTSGYSGLLSLARAVARKQAGSTHITILSQSIFEVIGTENLRPEQALLLGPHKIIPQEYKNITCSMIDLALSQEDALLLDQLAAEVVYGRVEGIIALRGKYRWTQTFCPFQPGENDASLLKSRGTYVITGGLGAIGLTFAATLARTSQANLVLISRSHFPDRSTWDEWLASHAEDDKTSQTIRTLIALEQSGSTLLIRQADVADREAMKKVIADVLSNFQCINGVIHCAGVADGALIQGRTQAWEQRILSAKVQGTLLLDELLQDVAVDFVLLCSALSAVVAPIGQVGYVSANSFLDAFAQYKCRQSSTRWLSIGWDTWRDAGMAVVSDALLKASVSHADYQARLEEQTGYGISNEEGASIFLRTLPLSIPYILTTRAELAQKFDENRALAQLYAQQTSVQSLGAPLQTIETVVEIERVIHDIWTKFIEIDARDQHSNWFDLGASSLDIIQVASMINAALGTDVTVPDLFTFSTIQALADFIYHKNGKPEAVSVQENREERLDAGKSRLKNRLERTKRK
ncbi:type I polyketide synthase [Tengunoibacter tsumagoiensis]|uniref:Polyketide synthase n=1 Tax=Tengunoibacter tsumagoiensis TaxID=2014871 RepID=A0A402A965_9CHLR|nr:type I polyketide synthase [Tengunoibacter tsumagoiensis]GCE15724.1 polyketide synthase [Tengunoibacter tsumagoiensis]